MIQHAWMDSRHRRLALEQYKAVTGELSQPAPAPRPRPAQDLDDRALVAATQRARSLIERCEPFDDLAEPDLEDAARTAAELGERHRDLSERRAALDAA